MPLSIRSSRRFLVSCSVIYHAGLFEGRGIILWNLLLKRAVPLWGLAASSWGDLLLHHPPAEAAKYLCSCCHNALGARPGVGPGIAAR